MAAEPSNEKERAQDLRINLERLIVQVETAVLKATPRTDWQDGYVAACRHFRQIAARRNSAARGCVMVFEVMRSRDTMDEWRVEAIDAAGDGQVYVAIFSGPCARDRAEEYAAFKNAGEAALRTESSQP